MKNKNNFFENTFANFQKVANNEITNKEADYISYSGPIFWADSIEFDDFEKDEEDNYIYFIDYNEEEEPSIYEVIRAGYDNTYLVRLKQKSSEYWYTEIGVYRKSNHWGICKSCNWLLNNQEFTSDEDFIGFCEWSNFKNIVEEVECS